RQGATVAVGDFPFPVRCPGFAKLPRLQGRPSRLRLSPSVRQPARRSQFATRRAAGGELGWQRPVASETSLWLSASATSPVRHRPRALFRRAQGCCPRAAVAGNFVGWSLEVAPRAGCADSAGYRYGSEGSPLSRLSPSLRRFLPLSVEAFPSPL